ncbi:hypothetical protein SLS53_008883 [Cytospora paraplurivora]|uniref:Uncharacterized protein n=1 Tax=Cytospora paraplurivora TaxID=2898453 RepID=A0AAN9YCL4_9PEZI
MQLSATEEDARKHGIKPGYNLEHWDPREAPFVLCGSVYDANSLGKAIFDTTVAVCGDKTDPVAKAAGELWLLLIHFAGCYKRAMEALDMVQNPLEMGKIETYIHYGFGEMKKLDKLLQECDEITRRALEEGESGMELVKNLFSHSRVSELTGRSMQSLRSWQSGFDAICEPILKKHGKELNLPGRDAQDANSTR